MLSDKRRDSSYKGFYKEKIAEIGQTNVTHVVGLIKNIVTARSPDYARTVHWSDLEYLAKTGAKIIALPIAN